MELHISDLVWKTGGRVLQYACILLQEDNIQHIPSRKVIWWHRWEPVWIQGRSPSHFLYPTPRWRHSYRPYSPWKDGCKTSSWRLDSGNGRWSVDNPVQEGSTICDTPAVQQIEQRIFVVRNRQVIMNRDLDALYDVETSQFNRRWLISPVCFYWTRSIHAFRPSKKCISIWLSLHVCLMQRLRRRITIHSSRRPRAPSRLCAMSRYYSLVVMSLSSFLLFL